MRTHADDNSYRCSWPGCQKTFTKDQHRRLHEEKQHPALITCEGCKRFFLTADSLNHHHQTDIGAACRKFHQALVALSSPTIEDVLDVP
ncbi:hypothetical protein BXZ70DRAFT_950850 [Cristinia sonorae]|uniref:C2H2-type domain-containing protein n=1 Tax=Cristinia sonorae TaxID=1940300 RepID=A0A8K0XMS4_9AGAR|nr:hypothetical protein BXZ70DRAFT_950850 [Cristinia sonorae]